VRCASCLAILGNDAIRSSNDISDFDVLDISAKTDRSVQKVVT